MQFSPLARTPEEKIAALQTALTQAEIQIRQLEIQVSQIMKALAAKGIPLPPRSGARPHR